jgi:hypothetical protein
MAHQRVSRPRVQFHEVTATSWMITNNRIEDEKEWAIVHDLHNKTWEVWANGKLHGICNSEREADRRMDSIIEEYLEDPSRW